MIIIYALGAGKYPALFDSAGVNITNKMDQWPSANFGIVDTVAIRPVKDDFKPYTKAELDIFTSFDFGIDKDWDRTTLPIIRTITGFTIEEVEEIIVEADPENGIEQQSITWAQIVCTVDYGTDEADSALGSKKYLELDAELNGYKPGEDRPGLIIQFPHLLLGRILESGTGTPNPVEDGALNSSQIYALVQAAPIFQYSVDGATDWHDTQVATDRYYREQRNGGEWSAAIAFAFSLSNKDNDVPAAAATAFELGRLDAGRGFDVCAMFTDEESGGDEGASLKCQVFISGGTAKVTNKVGFSDIGNLNVVTGTSASITGVSPNEVVNLVVTTTAGNDLKMNYKAIAI